MNQLVVNKIEKSRLIVIIRGIEQDKILKLGQTLKAGGVKCVEITFDTSKKISDQQVAQTIKLLSDNFKGDFCVGAGTVLTKKQVGLVKRAGGQFIVTPETNISIIKSARRKGLATIIGALTPTEIRTAHKFGADFVKIFPAGNFGPDYIKQVKVPLSDVKFFVYGGIDIENIGEFKDVGVCGFGIGSFIVNNKLIDDNDFAQITQNARQCIDIISKK